ncbi:MAG: hypothetical protein R3E66_10660 [bacterium]
MIFNQTMFQRAVLMWTSALLFTFVGATAFAQSWGGGTGRPAMKDIIPEMSESEAYSERYGFAVDLDGGGHIGVDFTISNLGWGNGHGAVEVRVIDANKKKYKFSKKLDDDSWTYDKGKFVIDIAGTRVQQEGKDSFRLIHKGATSFDVVFENRMPMWRPGRGKIKVGDDGYYEFNLIAPRADVKGTVNGKPVTGTRNGYADHVATNVEPYNLATRFTRMRNYNGDVFVIWREITLTKDAGGKSLTWVMVGYKDDIVFSDTNARLKEGRIKVDPVSNYRIPLSVQIDAKNGQDSIKLVMRGKTYKRTDLLDSYGDAAKLVASAFAKPVRYTVDCDYQLQMTIAGATATISGETHYVVDQIN